MKVMLEIDGIGFDFPIMEKCLGKIIEIPCIPVVGMYIDIELFYSFTDEESNSLGDQGMCRIDKICILPEVLELKLVRDDTYLRDDTY